MSLIKNYLKITLRSILKQMGYSVINITGLAIGITCTILIFLWIQDELNYDRYNEKADQIYRVVTKNYRTGEIQHGWKTPAPLARSLQDDIPEIVAATRYLDYTGREVLVKYDGKNFNEVIGFADPSIFDMFTFTFIKGEIKSPLSAPYSAIVTEDMAQKYFGDKNPVGEILNIDNRFNLEITGIIKNLPRNGQLKFDFLTHFEVLKEFIGTEFLHNWGQCSFTTYVLIPQNTNINNVNAKISGIIEKNNSNLKMKLYLQPLTRVHLYALGKDGGPIIYVYIFLLVALFILVIAAINFINLSVARSATRAKEVGLRKVVGANRKMLIKQFLGESMLQVFFAMIIAIFLVELLLPSFNDLTRKQLAVEYLDFKFIVGFVFLIIFTGILSGAYPAFFISSFKPAEVLKAKTRSGSTSFRHILVFIQFSISTVLIICTIVVSRQLIYISKKDLGFRKDNLVYIKLNDELKNKYESIRNELLQNPNIENVTLASNIIGVKPRGKTSFVSWEGKRDDQKIMIHGIGVGYDFIETFGMKLAAGRDFSREFGSDTSNYILNEEAIRQMEMKSPIGKQFTLFDKGEIIGVVKDFNFESLYSRVKPLALFILPGWYSAVAVRIGPGNVMDALRFIKETIMKFAPPFPFEYHFLDDYIENLYSNEERVGKIIAYFAFLAVLIAALGLFGLASFTIQQQTKEIGVRKVLGASVSGVILLLFKRFTKGVLLANIIAWPIAYYVMTKWLRNFAYQTSISLWIFIFTTMLVLAIAVLTVSYRSIKAALTNPVKALRYE